MNQREVKRRARVMAAGLIEAALSEGVIDNLVEHGVCREDAVRIEEELQLLAQRLSGSDKNSKKR